MTTQLAQIEVPGNRSNHRQSVEVTTYTDGTMVLVQGADVVLLTPRQVRVIASLAARPSGKPNPASHLPHPTSANANP